MSLRRSGLRNKLNIDSNLSVDTIKDRLIVKRRSRIEIFLENRLFYKYNIFKSKTEYLLTLFFTLLKSFTYSGFSLSSFIWNSFAGGSEG